MNANRETGGWGERVAAGILQAQGWQILETNWRPPAGQQQVRGELDLIGVEDGRLVVCEVKTRRSTYFGHPFEAITEPKARRLHLLAAAWARAHEVPAARIRVDAVAITGTAESFTFEHLKRVG